MSLLPPPTPSTHIHSTLPKNQWKNILQKGLTTTTKKGEAEEKSKTSAVSKTEHQNLSPGAFVGQPAGWPLAFHSMNICSVPTVWHSGCCGECKHNVTWLWHFKWWQYSDKEAKSLKEMTRLMLSASFYSSKDYYHIPLQTPIATLFHWLCSHHHGTLSQRMNFHGSNRWGRETWREDEESSWNHSIPYYSSKTSNHSH